MGLEISRVTGMKFWEDRVLFNEFEISLDGQVAV